MARAAHLERLRDMARAAEAAGLRRVTRTARNYSHLGNGEEWWDVVVTRKDGLAQWGKECRFEGIVFLCADLDGDWRPLSDFDENDLD